VIEIQSSGCHSKLSLSAESTIASLSVRRLLATKECEARCTSLDSAVKLIGTTSILFVKPANNKPLSAQLIAKIRTAITTNLSRRHVPSVFIECSGKKDVPHKSVLTPLMYGPPDIPYTTNGKRVEVAVKKLINGYPLEKVNSSGMANPESLKFFVNHPALSLSKAKL
jgi:hypothetical protein